MKRSLAVIAALLAVMALASGCVSNVAVKSQYEVTVFVESPLGDALTDIAAAYTNAEVNPNANKESEILLASEDVAALEKRLQSGGYCDIYISSAPVSSAKLVITGTDGTEYKLNIVAGGENPDATQAFVDYLKSDKAVSIFAEYGFTVS